MHARAPRARVKISTRTFGQPMFALAKFALALAKFAFALAKLLLFFIII